MGLGQKLGVFGASRRQRRKKGIADLGYGLGGNMFGVRDTRFLAVDYRPVA